MFERTFVEEHGETARAWPLAVSLLGQTLALCLAILIPLMSTTQLPAVQWAGWLLGPPPPGPPPSPPVTAQAPKTSAPDRVDESLLRMPPKIPEKTALIVDDLTAQPPPNLAEIAGGVRVVRGVPGGVPGGILTSNQRVPEITRPPAPSVPMPETTAAAPLRVSGHVQAAKLIHKITPPYPRLAKQAGISGVVRLEAIIAEDGEIQELRVLSGHPLLVATTIEAVKQWRYQPTRLNGRAVQVVARIDVHYSLRE